MRFSTVAIVASVIAAASAVDYPFKPNGPCVQPCLDSAGKEMYSDYTTDPNNPHFIESLSYAHDRGTPKYTTYMTKTGMCISGCPKAELDLYNEQYQAKSDWYQANKNSTVKPTSAASNVAASAGLIGAAAIGAAVLLF